MAFITLDFETFYDNETGFKKQNTEEYLNDPRFQVIGVGIKEDEGETEWFTGEDVGVHLRSIDWDDSAVLCHNAQFDCAILSWHYKIYPAHIFDTLSMARAVHGVDAGGSLSALAKRYDLGEKGTEVVNAFGKRLEDFSPTELAAYGEYCKNDVELTYKLFHKLSKNFPDLEYELIDMTVKMFTEPSLLLNDALLVDRLNDVREEKNGLLRGLMEELGCGDEEGVRKELSSNPKFAALLKQRGVTVPTKVSPTTGKETYALAKNDEGFLTLQEHEDPIVQQLCAVRLGTKSTIEESRIERFIGVGERNKGLLPIPLKYYGAHTGRWSGQDGINMQNLPSRDKKKKALKNAIYAPDGYFIVNCDSSQIEARVLAWIAGQDDVVEQFRKGEDVYSTFASKIYKRNISKADPVERFVGKTCVAEGTLVLSYDGWKPIEKITTSDKLWDGEEWVCHQGLLYNGIKPTLSLCGAWLTPDHQVWSGTQWLEAQSVVADESTLFQVLDTAAENLPWSATSLARAVESVPSSFGVTATQRSTPLTTITSRISKALAALCAPRKRRLRNAIGCTAKQWQTMPIGLAYSIVSLQQSLDATTSLAKCSSTMVGGVSGYATSGEATARRSSGMFKLLKAGTTLISRWIESVLTAAMNRGISASYRAAITSAIKGKSRISKPVYDILNSGSRNRFTILTEAGPVIVHNCVLGLGYGTGAEKLRHTLKTSPPGADLPLSVCQGYVDLYRDVNYNIVNLWYNCGLALKDMMSGVRGVIHPAMTTCFEIDSQGIRLPNSMYIRYPNLRLNTEGRMIYDSRRGPVSIWGGAMVENIVQALARIIVGEQMVSINERYPVVLTVHDAAVCLVPQKEIEDGVEFITNVMSTPPTWAQDLPVACEAKYGVTYGDC